MLNRALSTKLPRITKAGKREALAYELFLSTYLTHVANDYHGDPFLLEDWQRKYLWEPMFGAGRMEGGTFVRKHRTVVLGLPRDSGKSEVAVAALITEASMNPVYEGEYGVIASSEKQAGRMLTKVKRMIQGHPDLRSQWTIYKDVIEHQETGARIMVFPHSAAAAQSYHFNVVIIDEYHEHRDDSVLDAAISGQKNIPNSLCIVTTTASKGRSGPLWESLQTWKSNPYTYVCWIGAEDDDDIADPKVWEKVSPMSWVTLSNIDYQFNNTRRWRFERYTMNRFPLGKAAAKAVKPQALAKCVKLKSEFDITRPFFLGIDGAQRGDAFMLVAIQRNGGYIDAKEWPFLEPDEDLGYYDHVQIMELIVWIHTQAPCVIGMDPARLIIMSQLLEQEYQVPLVALKQRSELMCPATALLVNAVNAGKLRLSDAPVTAEHIGNATVTDKGSWGERLDKVSKKPEDRIDGAIAAAIALFMEQTQEVEDPDAPMMLSVRL